MIRILSAAVLIALLVTTVWFLHPFATVGVAALLAILGAGELSGLSLHLGAPLPTRFVAPVAGVICAVFGLGLTTGRGAPTELLPIVLLAVIVAAGLLALAAGPPGPTVLARAAACVMAPLYVGLPLGAIARVRVAYGPQVVSVLAILVIVSDSAQYFVGRMLGRRKLIPLVSPAKTVEGAVGGVIAAAITGAIGARWIPHTSPAAGAAMGLLVAVFGIAGDLFESLLKRGAGVKDSSALIPGHGGVLDRIDSWLFAGPIYYVFLRYFA